MKHYPIQMMWIAMFNSVTAGVYFLPKGTEFLKQDQLDNTELAGE